MYISLIGRDLRVYESEKTLIDPSLIREARGIEGIEWQAGKGSKILERNDPDTLVCFERTCRARFETRRLFAFYSLFFIYECELLLLRVLRAIINL